MTIRDIFIQFGYQIDPASEKKANNSINSLKSFATKALGIIGIGFSLIGLKNISEEYNQINNKIRDATRGMGDQAGIQQTILKTANDTTISYADMADTVSKLAQNNDVFSSVEDAANFAGLLAKNFVAAGKSSSEAAGLMQQMTVSISKGKVDSPALMALIRESPGTVKLLSDSIGVSSDEFMKMASKGKISAKQLKEAFESNAGAINSRFGEVRYNISDAIQNIRDQWGLFVTGMDDSLGISQTVGTLMVKGFTKFMNVLKNVQKWIEKVAKRLGGMKNLIKLVSVAAGAIFIAMNAGKIMSFLSGIGKALKGINVQMLLIIAVAILIFLIVDDFMAFMRGDNSLIGEALKKMGIDADDVRKKILDAWENIKTFLSQTWEFIKNLATTIFNGLTAFWKEHGDEIKAFLLAAWVFIKTTLVTLWNGLKTLAIAVFNALQAFWAKWGDKITAAFFVIWDFIKSSFQNTVDAIMAVLHIFTALFQGDWQGVWDGIKEYFSIVWKQIKNILKTALGIVNALFGDKIDAAKNTIVNGFNTVKSWFASLPGWFNTNVVQPVSNFFSGLWQGIQDSASTAWEWLQSVWSTVSNWFNDNVIQPLKDFWQGLSDKASEIWDLIKSGFDILVDGFKTGVDNIVSFFQPFLDVINKVNEFVGGAMQKVGDWISGKAGAVKNFFTGGGQPSGGGQAAYASGTDNTPDTFIAGEQGPELITGASGKKVFTAGQTGDIFKTLKSIVSLGAAPRAGTVAATSSSVENKSIVQNVEITNQFNGDHAGQQKSAAAMDKAANDATGYMARGLAYVR